MSYLERNLKILFRRFPRIAAETEKAEPSRRLRFMAARDGSPNLFERFGDREFPLHSTIAPAKEAERFAESTEGAGFIVVYGLGAGPHVNELIRRNTVTILLIVDDAERLKYMLSGRDYRSILEYPGLILLLNPGAETLQECIIDSYLPALHGDFIFAPLRSLAARNTERLDTLKKAAETAISRVRSDFSVQSHLGLRWTKNTLANLPLLDGVSSLSYRYLTEHPKKSRSIIVGAGPSLKPHLHELHESSHSAFVIAVDTALPVLLERGIGVDAVVSIDSQHYTLLHSEHPAAMDIPWIITLSAPHSLTRRLKKPMFFSGGTPLEQFIARRTGIPSLDTKGGNVLQSAFSAAAFLQTQTTRVFGADYANPLGIPYCAGTYIDRWFQLRSSRTSSLLSRLLSFTFDSRGDATIVHYDPLYPTDRLGSYKDRIQQIITCLPFDGSFRGVFTRDFTRAFAPGTAYQDFDPVSVDSLKQDLAVLARKDSSDTLKIIYPLAAYFRGRDPFGDAVAQARKLFIRILTD